MIEARNLGRDYQRGERTLTVLDGVSFQIESGEFVSITGPSGSGKSTLLGILAGLDRPTRGDILLESSNLNEMSETELSRFRGSRIGFVFQNFQLVPTLTALENVSLPLRLQNSGQADARARQMLERVGLTDRLSHYPAQLSGGEMQRVAIARASVISPSILFADEPTGNLDSGSGDRVIDLLMEQRKQCTLVLVTHNPELAGLADREIRLLDGHIDEIVVHRKAKGRSSSGAGEARGRKKQTPSAGAKSAPSQKPGSSRKKGRGGPAGSATVKRAASVRRGKSKQIAEKKGRK
ncbi:MAG: ABC transporter ATP-binding protein [Leptospiraceae bacterium]|nr:ABC transporter ATP-binding protein [Leptospiraceae bacterium]